MNIKEILLTIQQRSSLSQTPGLKTIELQYDRLCEELVRTRLDLIECTQQRNNAERDLGTIKAKLQELIARL